MNDPPFLIVAGAMLCAFFAVSYTSQSLRLPSVLSLILLGAAAHFWFFQNHAVHLASEIGIVLMFFVLGLEFPLARLRDISRKIWPAGLLDVLFNLGGTIAIGWAFGLDFFTAFTIGSIAYATSSSMSAKMLDEKKRLASPETEFILALLIFEDLVAPVLVSVLAGTQGGDTIMAGSIALLTAKLILLTGGAIFLGIYGFRKISAFVERNIDTDFMPLFSVGIALGYAGFAVWLGLSEILGAFLAGMMLSETGRSAELERLTLPIRDLCLPFFFFWFGTSIRFGEGVSNVGMLAALIGWAVAGKVISVYAGASLYGLSPRVACRAAFSMVQRGEFSAIIASLAPPAWRVFSGIYILVTAGIGMLLFGKAPVLAKWFDAGRQRLAVTRKSQRPA